MTKFTSFSSRVIWMQIDNVDTDQIIPARFLKTISKEGFGDQLFYDWRYDAQGQPRADFVLNHPLAKGVQILLAGDNFGCGSSREHAPWALTQFGFRAVISTSFADIFKQNALKNSLLPIVVSPDVHELLRQMVAENPFLKLRVDLAAQRLMLPSGQGIKFPVDPFAKHCLLEGIDELEYVLEQEAAIAAYESEGGPPLDTL
ncbi:MAG: 3-isopropylmalate dehydratase small subunit, partial [Acidobacteria bacterium]|nr:3-isopropylmalate dehydratase small subunit [Acidobacteriota bacterium]